MVNEDDVRTARQVARIAYDSIMYARRRSDMIKSRVEKRRRNKGDIARMFGYSYSCVRVFPRLMFSVVIQLHKKER